ERDLFAHRAAEQRQYHRRHEAALHLGIAEPGPLMSQHEIAGGREAAAAGEGISLYHRDNGLRQRTECEEELSEPERLRLILLGRTAYRGQQLAQVDAGAEVPPGPAQQHHPDRGIEIRVADCPRELSDELGTQRVAPV